MNPTRVSRFGIGILVLAIAILICSRVEGALFSGQSSVEKIRQKLSRLPTEGRHRTKAILYSDLGTLLYRQGEPAVAADQFEKALAESPSRSMKKHIYLYLGKSYESSGRLDKAIRAYEEAVDYDPKNWKRHRDLAGLYELLKLYQKAIQSYEQSLRVNPKEPSVMLSLGRSLRKMGIYSEAAVFIEKSLGMRPDSRESKYELSLVREGQGRYSSAAEIFDEYLGTKPNISDWGRLIYLSGLGEKPDLVNKGMNGLESSGASKETLNFYENLIELLKHKPEQILSQKTRNPALQELFEGLGLGEPPAN
jgi:tetratricopeptide (TPR) repeat protein